MGFYLEAASASGDSIKNIWLGKFDIFPEELFSHAVSTRHGGVSTGEYDSLNLGLHVEDDAEVVWRNRQLFCEAVGVSAERLVTCQQVHSANIVRVTEDMAGRGNRVYSEAIQATDALITDVPGLPIMLFFADCTPILLADPVHKAIALAHGGWKGTVQSIAAKTVADMGEAFGSRPEDMLAAVGPAIGPCCYEIGTEVAQQFRESFPDFCDKILDNQEGHIHLDLWQANALQLEKAGIPSHNIDVAGVCTSCNNSQFFSYRADGKITGRIGALLCIR